MTTTATKTGFYSGGEAGDANEVGRNRLVRSTGIASNHTGRQTHQLVRSSWCGLWLHINYIVISYPNIGIDHADCAKISSHATLVYHMHGRTLAVPGIRQNHTHHCPWCGDGTSALGFGVLNQQTTVWAISAHHHGCGEKQKIHTCTCFF